jgi:hypothetical protein
MNVVSLIKPDPSLLKEVEVNKREKDRKEDVWRAGPDQLATL